MSDRVSVIFRISILGQSLVESDQWGIKYPHRALRKIYPLISTTICFTRMGILIPQNDKTPDIQDRRQRKQSHCPLKLMVVLVEKPHIRSINKVKFCREPLNDAKTSLI